MMEERSPDADYTRLADDGGGVNGPLGRHAPTQQERLQQPRPSHRLSLLLSFLFDEFASVVTRGRRTATIGLSSLRARLSVHEDWLREDGTAEHGFRPINMLPWFHTPHMHAKLTSWWYQALLLGWIGLCIILSIFSVTDNIPLFFFLHCITAVFALCESTRWDLVLLRRLTYSFEFWFLWANAWILCISEIIGMSQSTHSDSVRLTSIYFATPSRLIALTVILSFDCMPTMSPMTKSGSVLLLLFNLVRIVVSDIVDYNRIPSVVVCIHWCYDTRKARQSATLQLIVFLCKFLYIHLMKPGRLTMVKAYIQCKVLHSYNTPTSSAPAGGAISSLAMSSTGKATPKTQHKLAQQWEENQEHEEEQKSTELEEEEREELFARAAVIVDSTLQSSWYRNVDVRLSCISTPTHVMHLNPVIHNDFLTRLMSSPPVHAAVFLWYIVIVSNCYGTYVDDYYALIFSVTGIIMPVLYLPKTDRNMLKRLSTDFTFMYLVFQVCLSTIVDYISIENGNGYSPVTQRVQNIPIFFFAYVFLMCVDAQVLAPRWMKLCLGSLMLGIVAGQIVRAGDPASFEPHPVNLCLIICTNSLQMYLSIYQYLLLFQMRWVWAVYHDHLVIVNMNVRCSVTDHTLTAAAATTT